MIDFDDINARVPIAAYARAVAPGGKMIGHEWIAPNPTRADRNAGSFKINVRSGKWREFADGGRGAGGGDMVSLCAYIFGLSQGAAAQRLADEYGDQKPQPRSTEARPTPIFPVPDDAPSHTLRHAIFGDPSIVWTYRNDLGAELLHVARYDPPGERKQVIPWTFCQFPDGARKWRAAGITGSDLRPLYGRERMRGRPDAAIVIVEGEKSADAAHRLLGERGFIGMAWLGGTNVADKVDVTPLRGRKVILWPDRDNQCPKNSTTPLPMGRQPGVVAMQQIARRLTGIASEILFVPYTFDDECGGWDIADGEAAGWTSHDAFKHLTDHARPIGAAVGGDAPSGNVLPWSAPPPIWNLTETTSNGRILATLGNFRTLMDAYGVTLKYNQTSRAHEISIPGCDYGRERRENSLRTEIISKCSSAQMPISLVGDFINVTCYQNVYNPIRDWIESRPWDGVSRLGDLFETIESPSPIKEQLMFRWFLSLVAAIYADDFVSHGMIVLAGRQGAGKTRWFRRVFEDVKEYTMDSFMLDLSQKDSIIRYSEHWCVELGELDSTFRRSDIGKIKAFVTGAVDKLRVPYDRSGSEFRRQTVPFATVNDQKFLIDDTGNRRFWTIPTDRINYQFNIDMQQVFAELRECHWPHEPYWLTEEEQSALAVLNEAHRQQDPIEELISMNFDWASRDRLVRMSASQVLKKMGYDRANSAQCRVASKILQRLTGMAPVQYRNTATFMMPPLSVAVE